MEAIQDSQRQKEPRLFRTLPRALAIQALVGIRYLRTAPPASTPVLALERWCSTLRIPIPQLALRRFC
jgi:hypothetical protein